MATTALDLAFQQVGELAARFEANEARYVSSDYQEAEVRKDFIDKFFIALGWDVNHDAQTNPYAQEVKVERSHGGTQRRADYAFYLAPHYRDVSFYVEAKKPHGEIATADNNFQTIRYGSGSRTSLAVLTSFEQFHILDTRFKADIKTALKRTVSKYHYTDYADRDKFAEIYWLFSREAVAGGGLEKFAATLPKKGKDIPPPHLQNIDDAFLDELEQYRDQLAHAFKAKNPCLDSDQLTEITQRTLDRLVFLRFLEDKQIEERQLVARFANSDSSWQDFIAVSRRLDAIYNGIVFKEHSILDASSFNADNEAFARICRRLSDEYSPYNFDAIPIHILGSIYERFLGKVIIATDKRVRVEEKPEVRKAGGVYYTPEYIVRYIVENTVGKRIEGKTPVQIAGMCFADIACGSGSFLLGVYDLLLRYHGTYYNANHNKARREDCVEHDGQLYLTLRKKREILLNNIFGVDIDAQAVEVAQLSLYLKLLEEENTASAHAHQLEFHNEALLPSLTKNIVCGNSLIGTDVLEGQLFAGEEERKLNPMNFGDAFPAAMKRGGFDAIVGNPPYVFARDEGFSELEKKYFGGKFSHQKYQLNTFALFTERGHGLLLNGGYLGFIIPNNWLSVSTMKVFRDFLVSSTGNLCIVNNLFKVFRGANVDTSQVSFQKTKPNRVTLSEAVDPATISEVAVVDPKVLLAEPIIHIRKRRNESAREILARIQKCSSTLETVALVKAGLKAYETGKGTPPQTDEMKKGRIYHSTQRASKTHRQYLDGRDVRRYLIDWSGSYLKYGGNLAAPRSAALFEGERILVRQIPSRLPLAINGVVVAGEELNDINSMIVKSQGIYSNKYILGIINSRLLSFWFDLTFDKFQRAIFPQFKVNELAQFPIRTINFSDPADKARHDEIVTKVESMLEAMRQTAKAQTEKDKNYYENKCRGLDMQIDRLVYDIYGMTVEEIAVVEKVGA